MSQYQCGGLPLRTPTHRRNGGPSHRRLPNAPHAHPRPPKGLSSPGMPPGDVRGISPLSEGCTPGGGRLHTCYSPVRRSPAGRASASPLPLDLRVLSLPLAFILSRIQTLRCLCFRLATNLSNCPSRPSGVVLRAFRKPAPERDGAEAPLLPFVLWHRCQCPWASR